MAFTILHGATVPPVLSRKCTPKESTYMLNNAGDKQASRRGLALPSQCSCLCSKSTPKVLYFSRTLLRNFKLNLRMLLQKNKKNQTGTKSLIASVQYASEPVGHGIVHLPQCRILSFVSRGPSEREAAGYSTPPCGFSSGFLVVLPSYFVSTLPRHT